MHTVYRHGAGAGGKPTRSQPLAAPQLIADVPFLYTAEEQAHMGAACCTVRLTVSHMKKKEEGDMLDRGCGMRGRRRRLECDLCL